MAKKRNTASDELEVVVKKLRASLDKAEAKAEGWKKKARQHKSAVSTAKAEIAKLERKLQKATRSSAKKAPAERTVAVSAPPRTARSTASGSPDASWTVVRLRAAARDKGVQGYSRKSKAELLAALR